MQKASDPRLQEPVAFRSSLGRRSRVSHHARMSQNSVERPSEAPLDENITYEVFVFTKNPTFWDYVFYLPMNLGHFMRNLAKAFGWKFVFIVCAVYGLQQGLGNAWFFQSRDYYFKDVEDLNPAEAQAYTAAAHTPWNIKPLYGMASDTLSFNGLNRTPYIAFAGAIGTTCLTLLSTLPLAVVLAVVLMFGVNLSVSSPDVMIDAVVAEKCKMYPKFASDLQSLCWGSFAVFSVIGFGTSGLMIQYCGPQLTFGILVFTSLLVLIPALLGFLGEKRSATAPKGNRFMCYIETNLATFREHKKLFLLALFVSVCAVSLSVIVLATTVWLYRFVAVLLVAFSVSSSVYFSNRKSLPDVANVALFIFLREALTPDTETTMFFWYSDADKGPHFSPVFVGIINMIGYITMFAGIAIYNKYMSSWQYRRIFTYTQLMMVATNLLDLVIVSRVNTTVGVPDECVIFGDATLTPMVRRFVMMPIFVLAAKVCPDGAEATLFALLMALSNFGVTVAIYFGSFLTVIFGVTDSNYDNLIYVVLIKALCRLLPIPLIPLLIPHGSPQEEDDFIQNIEGNSLYFRPSQMAEKVSEHRRSDLNNPLLDDSPEMQSNGENDHHIGDIKEDNENMNSGV